MRPRLGRQPGNSGNTIRQVLEMTINFLTSIVDGDRGAGDREKRGREAGLQRWREAGEKGKIAHYFAIEKMQRVGSQQIQGGNRD